MAAALLPAVALAAAGTGTTAIVASFTLAAVNLGISMAASYALNALSAKGVPSSSVSHLMNDVNSIASAEYVYGTVRKGGVVTYDEATNGNNILNRIIVLAAGENEVVEVYLDDDLAELSDNDYSLDDLQGTTYAGAGYVLNKKWMEKNRVREPRIRVFWHEGNQTNKWTPFANSDDQSLDSTLLQRTGNNLPDTFVGKGLTYLYVQFKMDDDVFSRGVPTVTATVRRKGIYDPRDGQTKQTPNWALCVADYLQSDNGLGDPNSVDPAELSVEANICDEAVTLDAGGTQNRYEANGVYNAAESPGDILSRLMPSGCGTLYWGQGKWNIRAGAYEGSVASFGLGDLRSEIQVSTRSPRAQNYNAVHGVFSDSDQRFIGGEYTKISSDTFLAVDGGLENVLEYDLPFETNNARAQRLAKLALYRQREQIRVEADFNMRAAQVQPGDVIDLTIDRYGWTNKEFEVTGWNLKIGNSGTLCVTLSLKETSEASFDWNADETIFESNNTNLPDSNSVGSVTLNPPVLSLIPNPEGAAITLVRFSWAITEPGLISDFVFEWRENHVDYDANGGMVEYDDNFSVREDEVYVAYFDGLRRAPDQGGFDFYVSGGGSGLSFDEVVEDVTNSPEGLAAPEFSSVVTRNTFYELNTLKYGQMYDFDVYARNAYGVRSDRSPTTFLVAKDNTIPKAPTGVSASGATSSLAVSWNAVTQNTDNSALDDLYQYQVYRHTANSFANSTMVAALPKQNLTFQDAGLANGTTYYYWVTAIDFSGNESAASTFASAATDQGVEPGEDGTNGDRTYTGRLYYHILTATSPGLPSSNGRTFNESTGLFNSLPPNWEQDQPSVDITDTTVLEWSCQYTVVVPGELSFPQTAVDSDNVTFSGLASAIQVTANIESDNFTAGSSGWQIERDTGNAEFNDVTVRGEIVGGSIDINNGSRLFSADPEGSQEIVRVYQNSSANAVYVLMTGDDNALQIQNDGDANGIYVINDSSANTGAAISARSDGSGSGIKIEHYNATGEALDVVAQNDGIIVNANDIGISVSSAGTAAADFAGYFHSSGTNGGEAYIGRSSGGLGWGVDVPTTSYKGVRVQINSTTSGRDAGLFTNTASGGGNIYLARPSGNGGWAFDSVAGNGRLQNGTFTPFTGSHEAILAKDAALTPGDIVCDTRIIYSDVSDGVSEVAASTEANQAACLGVFKEVVENFDIVPLAGMDEDFAADFNHVLINSVGEGGVNVNGEGGDIEAGDLIVTSSTAGKGMKQGDDIVRSYTVAKARESVTFSDPSEQKLIACIYLCG